MEKTRRQVVHGDLCFRADFEPANAAAELNMKRVLGGEICLTRDHFVQLAVEVKLPQPCVRFENTSSLPGLTGLTSPLQEHVLFSFDPYEPGRFHTSRLVWISFETLESAILFSFLCGARTIFYNDEFETACRSMSGRVDHLLYLFDEVTNRRLTELFSVRPHRKN